MSDQGFNISGTYKPCPQCRAPMVFNNGEARQKITFSGSILNPRITPHLDGCTATPEEVAAADNPWGAGPWGAGPFVHTTHGRDCSPGHPCPAPGCDGSHGPGPEEP